MTLTEKQIDTLLYIIEYKTQHPYPPTRFEIASHFGISINAVQGRLNMLVKKEAISLVPNISRGIVVL